MQLTCKQLIVISGGCIAVGALIGYGIALKFKYNKSLGCLINTCGHVWPFTVNKRNFVPTSIEVITSEAQFDEILPRLKEDLMQVKLLGFDCEWTSENNKKKPVALLQLASISGLCVLIRISKFEDGIPSSLEELLKNEAILKVGVGCHCDGQKLFNDYGLVVNGCVDLRFLAQLDNTVSLKKLGLQSLSMTFLNHTMTKTKEVRCSDWDAEILTEKQISYAADDALVGIQIFSKLIVNLIKSKTGYTQKCLREALSKAVWEMAYSYCQNFVDVKFKERSINPGSSNKHPSNVPQFKKSKYAIRKSAMYDNCKLEAPDGQLLATCDRKKADWYISKELADLVCEEPHIVRLRFEPAGRPASTEDYYLFEKENVCVVCKSLGPIVRKNIVPHEYRKHFPLEMKDHSSHDILPLCVTCHQKSGHYDLLFRNQLAAVHGAPLGSANTVQVLEDPERRSARSAGRALLHAGDKIPLKRKNELEKVLREFYSVQEISDDVIAEAAHLETRYKNESYIPHGEKVVTTIFAAEGLKGVMQFERKWREHFLKNMKPKHLPAFWSVDHNHRKVLQLVERTISI